MPPALSLSEALARADRVAAVAEARAWAEVEAARVESARAPASPVITLGTSRYSGDTFTASEELRWAGQRRFAVASAEGSARAASARSAMALVEARRAIRQAWFGLATSEDLEGLAGKMLERARQLTAATSAWVAAGRAPRLDLVRVRAEEAGLAARLASVTEERQAAGIALALLLGLEPGQAERTDAARPEPMSPAELERLHRRGRDADPALLAARAEAEAAKAAVALEQRRRLPGLALELGTTTGDPGLPGPDHSAALSFSIPLGAPGAAAQSEAVARAAAAQAHLTQIQRERATESEVAYHRALGAHARFEAYATSAVPAAEEAASLTREAWAAGRGDLVRVLDADRTLLEARQAQVEAYLALELATADLLASTGGGE